MTKNELSAVLRGLVRGLRAVLADELELVRQATRERDGKIADLERRLVEVEGKERGGPR